MHSNVTHNDGTFVFVVNELIILIVWQVTSDTFRQILKQINVVSIKLPQFNQNFENSRWPIKTFVECIISLISNSFDLKGFLVNGSNRHCVSALILPDAMSSFNIIYGQIKSKVSSVSISFWNLCETRHHYRIYDERYFYSFTANGHLITRAAPMREAKVHASLRIRAVSPEPPLLAYTSSESRGTFRQKARSLALLSGWAWAVKILSWRNARRHKFAWRGPYINHSRCWH